MFSLLNLLKSSSHDEDRQAQLYRELIRKEARLGGELFGPVPKGVRREFFCLDERTWIWHEEWTDKNGQRQIITTRYDIRTNGILKAQEGQVYRYVDREEGRRFCQAVRLYEQKMLTGLYAQ